MKAIDFTDGICETDEEGRKDGVKFVHVRYFLSVPVFNSLVTWSAKSFFFELVILGLMKNGFFGSYISRSMTKSLAQHGNDSFALAAYFYKFLQSLKIDTPHSYCHFLYVFFLVLSMYMACILIFDVMIFISILKT